MKTIAEATDFTFSERGSKFIGLLRPLSHSEEASEILAEIRITYPEATHYCVAWRLGPEPLLEFANDDGEPSGTAGLPMLNTLKSADLVNVMAVVIRYYGGTKLGKPGLIHAYREAIQGCVDKAACGVLEFMITVRITYPYQEQKSIDHVLHQYGLHVTERSYEHEITLNVIGKKERISEFLGRAENLHWRGIHVEKIDEGYAISAP